MGKRVIVLGAGPMGLEAALAAVERGFEVTVLERGRVGASLLGWGPTRFFSPFGMNVSARARALLGAAAPAEDALLTGQQMVERVLEPLATRGPLAGRVRAEHRVVGVARARHGRRDLVGHPLRAERPFRVLVETPAGEEVLEAEVVLDATGVTLPAAAGEGGLPALGERRLGDRFLRSLGALASAAPQLAGRRLLLLGHGHSAANAVVFLERLAADHPETRVVWATRSLHRRPCVEVANDPLPERARIVSRANQLASAPPPFLSVERRAQLEAVEEVEGGRLAVRLGGGRGGIFDQVAAFTGHRPDLSFVGELPLEVAAQSEGTAGVARALANVTDCLSVPRIGAEALGSGEPGFHFVGAKAYGRLPSFLLKDGLLQLEAIVANLGAA